LALSDFPELFLVYVIFAYVIGGPIALLAGLFVSHWMIRRLPNVLVVTAAAVLATVLFMGVAAFGSCAGNQRAQQFSLYAGVRRDRGPWLLAADPAPPWEANKGCALTACGWANRTVLSATGTKAHFSAPLS
jgi:hypothetical protein